MQGVALGEENAFLAARDARPGGGDVVFGHRADFEALFVFGEQLGRELARTDGAAQVGEGEVEVVVGEDDARDSINYRLPELPFADAAVGLGDADRGERGAEAEIAQQRLAAGDAGKGGEVVGVGVEGAAGIGAVPTKPVGHAPGQHAADVEVVGVGLGDARRAAQVGGRVNECRVAVVRVIVAAGEHGVKFAQRLGHAGGSNGGIVTLDFDGKFFRQRLSDRVLHRDGLCHRVADDGQCDGRDCRERKEKQCDESPGGRHWRLSYPHFATLVPAQKLNITHWSTKTSQPTQYRLHRVQPRRRDLAIPKMGRGACAQLLLMDSWFTEPESNNS